VSGKDLQSVDDERTPVNKNLTIDGGQLSWSSDDFQNLLAATGTAAVFLDHELRMRLYTPAAGTLFNFIATDLGRPLSDICRKLDGPEMVADAERSLNHGQPGESEVRAGQQWFVARAHPYRTADGHITGVVLTFIDITSHKVAENALRVSAARFRHAVEAVSSLIWTNNARGMMEGDQPGWEHFTGQDRASYEGFGWTHAVHPEDAQPTVDAWNQAVADKKMFVFEHRLRRKDGQWRLCAIRAVPVLDDGGEITEWVGVHTDITEQKRVEGEVARLAADSELQRRMYETVLTNTPDFMYVFSLDYKVLYANDALINMWGRGREGAIGKTFLEIGYEPWHAEMHSREIDQVRATGQPIRGEVPFNGTNGRRQYDYVFVPVFGANGEVEAVAGTTRDVTDRNAAEKQVRDRQDRLDFALAAADLGQWALNLADHTATRTLRHDQLFGYETLLPEWTYEMFLEHVIPADRAEVDAAFQTALLTGSAWAVECRIRRADGAVRHIWTKALIQRDADRKVESMLGIVGDITERRQAEQLQAFQVRLFEALRPLSDATHVQAESSRLLGEHFGVDRVAYFEVNGSDYVVEQDYTDEVPSIAGRYPIASFGADLLTMYRSGDTAVETDVEAMATRSPAEKAAFAALQIRSYAGVPLVKGGALVAGLTVHSAKVRIWSATEIAILEDAAERTWAAVERVKAESALRQSEERLRLALSAARMVAWEYDPSTARVVTSDNAAAVYGFRPGEKMGTIDQGFAILHPDDVARHQATVEQAVATGQGFTSQFRIIRNDTGSVQWMEEWGHAVRKRSDGAVQLFGVNMDITARKNAEAALKEADRQKDEFLATLAHELRNPLAPIRSGLQVMQMAGVDGKIEQTRSMMERQLVQLTRLVDDLLDVSRVTTGKLKLRTERIQVQDIINVALETSQPLIDQHGHRLSVAVPDEPIFADGDPIRLAQVVSNLLNNSAKYTHRGGNISVSVTRDGSTAAITVADDGVGIPKHMLENVFGMFTQVDQSLEKATGGLGIGLSLVKCLVQMHGGSIEAFSEGEGRGSEFRVRLPIATSSDGGSQTTDAHDAQPEVYHPCRILIVDDNKDAANALSQLLDMMGNEIVVRYDGRSGIEAVKLFQPEVVLCDIGMPKMNGYDTARNIRATEWGKTTTLIALTGFGQDDDVQRSFDAGFDHHLVKPVDVDALLALLTRPKPDKA
jgi:PAS domain S-box-containing protein